MGDIYDFNPVGTMTPMGLSPDDPLYDWASNMKPSDLQQFVHDPEGAKQNMIDQGIPPPDHHYVDQGNGQLQAVDPRSGQPVFSQAAADSSILGDPSQGNLTRDLNQPPQTARAAVEGLGSPRTRGLMAYTDPGGGFGQSPEGENLPPGGPSVSGIGSAIQHGLWDPLAPVTPNWQRPPPVDPSQMLRPGPEDLPKKPPLASTPEEAKPPLDITSDEQKKTLLQADTKKKEDTFSDLSKSLAGVKKPEPPKLPGLISQPVRSPTAVRTPGIEALLGLAGARAAQLTPLMRLLGRA